MSGFEILFGVLSAVGTGLSVAGKLAEGESEERAAKYNVEVARNQAVSEKEAAAAEAQDYRRRESRAAAASRAIRASQGVTMAGSPLLVEEDAVREAALGAARITHAGMVRATGYENDARLYRMRGRAARTTSYIRAGSSLLTGLSGLQDYV